MTVGLEKVNTVTSDHYEGLEVAIVKATSPKEELPEEIYLRSILDAVSYPKPRADVAYCIHALGKRLAQNRDWVVALKTLFVVHRALREPDPTFREELANYESNTSGHILNLSHFKDDSSPQALDYSAWVRSYASYLTQRLECYCVLKCDIETQEWNMLQLGYEDLLDHLTALQSLLDRFFACEPRGGSMHNYLIRNTFLLVASERQRIYNATIEGINNLVDKCAMLEEFYERWNRLDPWSGLQNFKIEPPNVSFTDVEEESWEVNFAARKEVINGASIITSGLDKKNAQALTTIPTYSSPAARNVEAVASRCSTGGEVYSFGASSSFAPPRSKLMAPLNKLLRRRPWGYDRLSEAV